MCDSGWIVRAQLYFVPLVFEHLVVTAVKQRTHLNYSKSERQGDVEYTCK